MKNVTCAVAAFAATVAFAADGWRPLFAPDYSDGVHDPDVWHVDADGNLTAEKDVAYWTKDEYSRFELECEYNLDPAGNSGVVIYCSDTENWIPNSVEIQLIDNGAPKWKGLNPRQANLAFFGHQAPSSNPARPAGEWNSFRLKADGPRLEVSLNGVLVNVCDLSQWTDAKRLPDGSEIPPWLSRPWSELATTGRIGFQGRHAGARVRFRNIRIRPLPATRRIRRLMSFNIRMGCGHDDPFRLPKGSLGYLPQCARVIGRCLPDYCGLQEVDRFSDRAGGMDQTAELAKLCGMEGSWVEKIPQYGISALYRERPFRVSKVLMKGRQHTRALMISEFPDCVIANTHYPLSEETCNAAAETTLAAVGDFAKDRPVFLMGDFNSLPDSEAVRILRREFVPISDPTVFTFPAKGPDRTIDYVFIDRAHAGAFKVLSRKVLAAPEATDHAALLVELEPLASSLPKP